MEKKIFNKSRKFSAINYIFFILFDEHVKKIYIRNLENFQQLITFFPVFLIDMWEKKYWKCSTINYFFFFFSHRGHAKKIY